jgi:glyoxylase-like metal-dependent hydrolase (beta-lactamase superfamily II)
MVRELTAGVWWIDLGRFNAYLVDDDVLTLVDAGLPWHADRIRAEILAAGFAVEDLERILVTHFDLDHVGGLPAFDRVEEILVGEADADYVAKRRRPPLSNRKTAFQRVADLVRSAPPVPVTPIGDGETVGSFTAIHTPGHTAGHTAFVSTDRDVAFVGDLVFSDGVSLSPSPWHLSQDVGAVRESILALDDAMPVVDVLAPGHGDPLVDGGYGAIAELAESVREDA